MTSVNTKSMDYVNGTSGAFKRSQTPGHSKFQSEKQPNFILLCLELLLPVAEKLISKEDRLLVEMCTEKLGMVMLLLHVV